MHPVSLTVRALSPVLLLLATGLACAQQTAQPTAPVAGSESVGQDLVSYPAAYFDRFQPITAYDMVRQVPGFVLAVDLNDVRGFAGSAGNVLIDDRRPSTKRDTLSSMLGRIPASSVARIELIRTQVRGIDMRGQSAVVNLILREGIPASVQWEFAGRKTFGHGPLKPEGMISLSDNWRGIDYNLGADIRWSSVGRLGYDEILDADAVVEEHYDDKRSNRNTVMKLNLGAASWAGETYWQFSTVLGYNRRHLFTDSDRRDIASDITENIFFDDDNREHSVELGLDLERSLSETLEAKAILIYARANEDVFNSQRDTAQSGLQTLYREAMGDLDTSEQIGRLEFDWSGADNHLVQFNIERARNVLDGTLIQTDDTGAGPVIIEVPGANSRVVEIRWDSLLKDTWSLGRYELEYGLGAEASTISQTGDAEQERDFFFLKPQGILTYSWANRDQSRIRLAREVAQLNLEDFVSATEFVENDILIGNPDLKPDATWKLEIGHEKRIGAKGVIKVTAFHHWITDVLDLLPITDEFEAPGNIGDGRRWGVIVEGTLPMDWLGLKGGKLDAKLRWQDSSVTDPVTGATRVLSIAAISGGPIVFDVENRYAYEVNFRQDFQTTKSAWGLKVMERAEQYRYKVNELEVYDENMDIHAFIETTRWSGVKMSLTAENILNFHEDRTRTKFIGLRDLTPVKSIEIRDRTRGFRLSYSISGSF